MPAQAPPARLPVQVETPARRTGSVRCPRCGEGDLFETRLYRAAGLVQRAEYCAGRYDPRRRRVLYPSCGYSDKRKPVRRRSEPVPAGEAGSPD